MRFYKKRTASAYFSNIWIVPKFSPNLNWQLPFILVYYPAMSQKDIIRRITSEGLPVSRKPEEPATKPNEQKQDLPKMPPFIVAPFEAPNFMLNLLLKEEASAAEFPTPEFTSQLAEELQRD